MKRVLVVALFLLLALPEIAFGLSREFTESLPEEVQELWDAVEQEDIQTSWHDGLLHIWERAKDFFTSEVRGSLQSAGLLILTAVLCGIGESCYQTAENEKVPDYIPLAGTLVITGIVAGNLQIMIGLGQGTIEQLNVLSKTVLPTLSAAVSASGGMLSASVRQVATVFFCNGLISVIKTVFLPLLNLMIVLSAADSVLPEHALGRLAELLRKGITWILTGTILLFTGYLTISGAAAGAADNLTVKLTRSAIATAVPVVGNIISEATSSVLAGAALLKSTVGILGMLGVLAVCITPFLTLGLQYLLYRVSALLAGIFTERLTKYLKALSSAFGLLLGMTGTCALLLLISISSSVSVVIV